VWVCRLPMLLAFPLCCNLSGGVALIEWFTTNGMCVKNNIIIYVARASNSKRDCEHDLYCWLLPWCEALRTCRSELPIATVAMINFRPWLAIIGCLYNRHFGISCLDTKFCDLYTNKYGIYVRAAKKRCHVKILAKFLQNFWLHAMCACPE